MLPKVAAEVSAPLSQVDKITMVSDGDGPIGASKVNYLNIETNYATYFLIKAAIPLFWSWLPLYIYGWLQVTGEVLDIMNSLPAMVQNMTGVDIKGRMAKA